ncbi:hypothetical protein ACI79G_15490 [Geodermatophilus sp. SYSU D00779]
MLLQQRSVAQEMAERFGRLGDAQRQGHVFEWMHEISFNLKAIAEDDDARLRVTTWLGEPHAPADLRVYGSSGEVLSEVQAKVVGNAAQRLAFSDGLASDKYQGMQLLVPSDHVGGTQSLLGRRLAMPEGPLHDRYAEVRANLTDRVTQGQLTSNAVTTNELADAARDPQGHLQSMIRSTHLRDVAVAGGTAAVTAGLTTGLVDVATALVRTGSLDGLNWTEVARRAAKHALGAGAAACIAEGLSGLGQHAMASGAGGWADALVDGGLDHFMGLAAFKIAGIAHGIATGRLSGEAAAWAAAETLTRATAGWACAAIGQVVIPVPVVGALIGNVVGQFGASMLVQGIRLAVAARDKAAAWDAEYEQLLRHTAELQEVAARELREGESALATYEVGFRAQVLPRLHRLQSAVATGRPDEVLSDLAGITRSYLGTPLFASLAEFDALMSDQDFTLVLDLGLTAPQSCPSDAET